MRVYHYIFALVGVMVLGVAMPEGAMAQYYPERKMVREGNKLFEARNFRRSLNSYNNALDHDSTSYEAMYNRANAYYQATVNKAEGDETYDFKTSNAYYEQVVADTLLTDQQRAELYRNLGESLFTQQEYEAALNSFRESLRLDPSDQEVKYNYMLTKRIVDQKRAAQNQQQQQNQDQDQNQDQNQNGEGGDNQNNNDPNQNENQNEGQDDQNGGGDDKRDEEQGDGNDNNEQPNDDEREQGGRPEKQELSPEQQRMLDAIQAQEDKTQEKLNNEKKGVIIPGKKNW